MAFELDFEARAMIDGTRGAGTALAMRVLVRTAELLGARSLISIGSAHIDGCLYHGDSGALFAERLVAEGAKVSVPSTLNVGALDLLHHKRDRLAPHAAAMARRMMQAYVALGCRQTWTCAPYQAGHRPAVGEDVAWGESNAVVFCNSVLGARTNRYGDFLDICAAITGRAPRTGLHLPENRRATIAVDASRLPASFWSDDTAWPVMGAWLGKTVGDRVAAFTGVPRANEDQLKAMGAAAASSGAIGLFHIVGQTPEAPDADRVFGGTRPEETIMLDMGMLNAAQARLSTSSAGDGAQIDAVAIGSPHLSADELRRLAALLAGRTCRTPLYACTGRHALEEVRAEGIADTLASAGVVTVADTCIVVTPILPKSSGLLVTNSGKFAHYTPGNTGYEVVFAPLSNCVESAVAGRLILGRGA
jgi:predicted aconitase